jgi:hypothetical protein
VAAISRGDHSAEAAWAVERLDLLGDGEVLGATTLPSSGEVFDCFGDLLFGSVFGLVSELSGRRVLA